MEQIRELGQLARQRLRFARHAWREQSALGKSGDHFIDAGKPLILISQIQRSGGTLLSQLFDGHPEVFAHPAEIQIGYPQKWSWLHQVDPNDWFLFEKLCERELIRMGFKGKYRKDLSAPATLPFAFSATRYRDTLLQQARADGSPSGLLHACMSAAFTAWLDYHHRDSKFLRKKRFVSGFVPRLLMLEKSVASLFESCPQVKILTVIRDPFSWYASAKRHNKSYRNIAEAMELWLASTQASLELANRRPDACKQLFFHDLVHDCSKTMRSVCDFIGLSWDDALLTPTFNGLLIRSDSSFEATVGVVDKEVTERWRRHLTHDEIDFIKFFVDGKPLPAQFKASSPPLEDAAIAMDRKRAVG